MLGKRHQGVMEYLLVVGIAVFICFVVLVTIINFASTSASRVYCGIGNCPAVPEEKAVIPETFDWILVLEVVVAEICFYAALIFSLRRLVFSKTARNFKEFFEIEEKVIGKNFKKKAEKK